MDGNQRPPEFEELELLLACPAEGEKPVSASPSVAQPTGLLRSRLVGGTRRISVASDILDLWLGLARIWCSLKLPRLT